MGEQYPTHTILVKKKKKTKTNAVVIEAKRTINLTANCVKSVRENCSEIGSFPLKTCFVFYKDMNTLYGAKMQRHHPV